jgi:chorismate mutase
MAMDARSGLDDLRRKIDAVDDRIVDLLAERFVLTREVGALKWQVQVDPVDQERENALFKRLQERAKVVSVDEALVTDLYRLLIDSVVREHASIRQEMKPG